MTNPPNRLAPAVSDPNATVAQGKRVLVWRKFPMGGFVNWNLPYREQRQDQGQDFEIPRGHHLIAPGWGQCVNHLDDASFPNGFGAPYAIVWFGSGRFKGMTLYLGHGNSEVIPVGHTFHTGDPLVRLDNGLNPEKNSANWGCGWGWVEVGVCANGLPQGDGTGARYHHLFTPVWRLV